MGPGDVASLAGKLAAGYPGEASEQLRRDFQQVLEAILPALTARAQTAQREGRTSVEEVWRAIRQEAEGDFHTALGHVDRLKVIYVASKFLNNRAVGTAITEVALARARGQEVDHD